LGTDVHRYLEPGDVVELEVERLGILKNMII
jgi:fumarylacetoacetate (FAA) hydrolase